MKSRVFIFGQTGLIGYLAFLNAFVPISTDLYLPALPTMAEHFDSTPGIVNLTLSLFMVFYAVSMLFWGPFADKYGRKPILLNGIVLYVAASVTIALCSDVEMLVFGRCLQAVGSGAVSAVSLAVVKDCFRGRVMESVLAWIQTITVLAPMIAPVVGGWMLNVTSWRGIFWVLTGCGVAALAGWAGLRETVAERTQGSAVAALARIAYVLKDRDFRTLLLVLSAASMAFMAYLATSSYIYRTVFHVTPQQFSYFFAGNAAVSVLGPFLYMRVFREFPKHWFVFTCFALIACSGLGLIVWGSSGAFAFALTFAPISIFGGALRPPSTMLLMNRLNTDSGTVSSLVGSTALLYGGASMLLCSLPWPSFILAAGCIAATMGVVCGCCWLWIDRDRKFSG